MKTKLTEVELSRILSAAANREIDFNDPHHCYASYGLGATYWGNPHEPRWWKVSDAVLNAPKNILSDRSWPRLKPRVERPRTAGDALRALRNADLV